MPPLPPGALPVGFRFRPTDEELVCHYLKPKIAGRTHPDLLLIPDVDLSACEPWELPAKALIRSEDPEWFFFAPLDRKYPGGHRSNRSTAAGYWKATGKDRLIRSRPAGTLIGIKKTLVFHRGRAPRGHRTAWIMHEYRTVEPQLQQGQNGSFVLYRLFDKHEEEEPEASDATDSQSTSSAADPPTIAPAVKAENSCQPTTARMAHLLTTLANNEPTAAQEGDPLLDVLAQLPDLQPEQTYHGFPTITSPMRPYTDHPFLGNMDGQEQDLSAYIDSIIAHQDLEGLLVNPSLVKTAEHPTGNVEPIPTSLLVPSSSSLNKRLPENSWANNLDSERLLLIQGADGTGATACCSSATEILQFDTGDGNHDTGPGVSAQASHLYSQYQLQSASIPQMEIPNSGALCSAGTCTPYPQHSFNNMVELAGSDMEDSDAFNGLEGWAQEPSTQQLSVSNLTDPHQGTAARRIRLVHSIQRASVTEPVLTSNSEGEDEARSCYSTVNSSTINNEDYANAGGAMHSQGGRMVPSQVVSSTEVTEKLQDFTLDEGASSLHGVLPRGGNLRRRLKEEYMGINQDGGEILQHSIRVPADTSLRQRRIGSVVRVLFVALVVIFVFVVLWKCI